MTNAETVERIRALEQEYRSRWGINADYTAIPSGMTQEMLVKVFERIVNTGESILAGFDRIKNG